MAGSAVLPLAQRPLAGLRIVSEDYFRTMHIAIVEGRPFSAEDREGAPRVCIVSESFAKRLFQVVGLFMWAGLRLVAVGLVLGAGTSVCVSQLLRALLFDVEPVNGGVYLGIAAGFTAVAAIACVVPSWRAAKVDPLIALRLI